ncbi:MAG: hypothetical protein M1570_12005 [Chloroflexi bacterium]|nr:hypothetical protein [Chloroflexota bacterium]
MKRTLAFLTFCFASMVLLSVSSCREIPPAAVTATGQLLTALPPGTAAPVAPTSTAPAAPSPTHTPRATRKPGATLTPTSTRTPVSAPAAAGTPAPEPPAFFEDFFGGTIDPARWKIETNGSQVEVAQVDGRLFLRRSEGSGAGLGLARLVPNQYASVPLDKPLTVEAKVMLASDHKGGQAGIGVQVSVTKEMPQIVQCGINADEQRTPTAACSIRGENSPGDVGSAAVGYDEWHTFRMVIEPDKLEVFAYLDGKFFGRGTLAEDARAPQAKLALQLEASWAAATSASTYVDDVLVKDTRELLFFDYGSLGFNRVGSFPASDDIFISDLPDWNSLAVISQTHASVVGSTHVPLEGKRTDYVNPERGKLPRIAHDAGTMYAAWITLDISSPITPLSAESCIDIDGNKVMYSDPPGGRYWVDQNSPVVRSIVKQNTKDAIDAGADIIALDTWEAFSGTLNGHKGCFSEYSLQGFRDYLAKKYTVKELAAYGIPDIAEFDYAEFIRARYLSTFKSNAQSLIPLFHDLEDFQMTSIKSFWHGLIAETRAYAQSKGKTIYFTANTWEMDYNSLPIADEVDYLNPEHAFPLPPTGRSIPMYKLACGVGKPAATIPHSGTTTARLFARSDATQLEKIFTAEAYSAGGYTYVPYALWLLNGSDFHLYSVDMQQMKPYYDFIHENHAVYDGLHSIAKVGVLYSYASAKGNTAAFYGISNLLLDAHLQYDVLFMGDGHWMKDKLTLAALNQYDVVVLPGPLTLSASQIDLLLAYAHGGGRIVAFGDAACSPDKSCESLSAHFTDSFADGYYEYGAGLVVYQQHVSGSFYRRTQDASTREQVAAILAELLPADIQTSANENVAVLEYRDDTARSTVLHIVNYNYDPNAMQLTSQTDIDFEIALDEQLLGKELEVNYASPDADGIQRIDYTMRNGTLSFQLPVLTYYGVVTIRERQNPN